MKLISALALGATGALAAVIPQQQELLAGLPSQHHFVHHEPQKFLIELAPYQTRWVTEEEKWALKLVRHCLLFGVQRTLYSIASLLQTRLTTVF